MMPTRETARSRHGVHPRGSGVDQPRRISASDNAEIDKTKAQTTHASRVAARSLVWPTPRSCSFVSYATIPLCRKNVSQALRRPLRSQEVNDIRANVSCANSGEPEAARQEKIKNLRKQLLVTNLVTIM
jgi:hypothetical protein